MNLDHMTSRYVTRTALAAPKNNVLVLTWINEGRLILAVSFAAVRVRSAARGRRLSSLYVPMI